MALDDRILAPAGGTIQGLSPTDAVDSFIPDLTPGDCDGDGDVDLDDYDCFAGCISGPGGGLPGGCATLDFDLDNDVDSRDFAEFTRVFAE